MKPLSLITTLLLVIHLASCAGTAQMYQGPEQPQEDVALIKAHDHPFTPTAVSEVDGNKTGFNQTSAIVQPGVHNITILTLKITPLVTYRAQGTLILNAEAGYSYKVGGKIIDEDNVWLWIEDENTGEIVAGRKPD